MWLQSSNVIAARVNDHFGTVKRPAIVINNGRGAARADHNRVTDIGAGAARNRLETSALIDAEITEARLDRNRPRLTANQQRAVRSTGVERADRRHMGRRLIARS